MAGNVKSTGTTGATSPNDLSDIRATTPAYSELSPVQLPIRGEKRIIPSFVSIGTLQDFAEEGVLNNGQSGIGPQPSINDWVITAAKQTFVDYMFVRLPHRGLTAQGAADPMSSATYRWLINPTTVSIGRITVDQQVLARAGWQFGVWGEDVFQIQISGITPGQYWTFGLTDAFLDFSQSYRNLQQLRIVFENNGYWFEGEEAGEGAIAADFTRRRIKMHQDVELCVGNYIWSGMFDHLAVSQDAENPFYAKFQISFLCWKERFRAGSPYKDAIHNDIQRGHSYSAYQATGTQSTQTQAATQGTTPAQIGPMQPATTPANNPLNSNPTVTQAQVNAQAPTVNPSAASTVFTLPLLSSPSNFPSLFSLLPTPSVTAS